MRIAICWHSISGYMAACWRALAARPGVELLVVTQRPNPTGVAPFDPALVAGMRTELVEAGTLQNAEGVRVAVAAFRPDVIVLNGWFVPAFNRLIDAPELAGAKFIMAMDRPRERFWKDHLTRVRKRSFLKEIDLVFVAGERCREFARFLGFHERQIRRGTYGMDFDPLAPLHQRRSLRPGGWPRSFVFTARYAPEKDVHTLVAGYGRYRSLVRDPWTLNACGKGELAGLLRAQEGINDLGFVQPEDQPGILEEQGVSVLVSRFEPWGVVVTEAAGAGLPLICSAAVGASPEMVQPYYNGLIVAPGDAEGVARAMLWMHEHHADLPEMGRRSREMAGAYSAQVWAMRWTSACEDALRAG